MLLDFFTIWNFKQGSLAVLGAELFHVQNVRVESHDLGFFVRGRAELEVESEPRALLGEDVCAPAVVF